MGQTVTRPGKRATYDDLLAVPEHLVAEILFGQLVTHPRPAPRHASAAMALGGVLAPPFQFAKAGPGGWIFMVEPELHLGEHVAVPDLAAWRRERLPALPETAWIETPPDWVCEVLSPSTERYDRGDKRTIYAEAGVGFLWHVDPVLKMLEVFELRDGKWMLSGVFHDDAEVAAPPFAEASFRLGLLWPFDSSPAQRQT
jgi:hypothetical protein